MSENLDALWKVAKPTAYAGVSPLLSNQMDATDAAGGIVDVKIGLDGKPIENLDALWDAAKKTKPAESAKPSQKFDWLRGAALTGRAIGESALGFPAMAADVMSGNMLKRSIGLPAEISPLASESVGKFFNDYSVTPQTKGERLYSEVVGGAYGAGLGSPAKTLGTAIAGGATGGLLSGSAKEAGANPLIQLGAGLLGNVGVYGLSEVGKSAGRAIVNLFSSPEKGAARIANLAAKKGPGDIPSAITQQSDLIPNMPLGAGQRAVETGNAPFAALQQLTTDFGGSGKYALDQAQKKALKDYIETVAQSGTNAREDTLSALRARTLPDRKQALDNANIAGVLTPKLEKDIAEKAASKVSAMRDAGQLATGAAQQQRLADTFTPVAGQPRVSGRISENIERVPEYSAGASDATKIAAQRRAEQAFNQTKLDSIPAEGFTPLTSGQLTTPLDALLTTPGPRASDMLQKSIGAVNDKFKEFSKDGIINAHDLDTIRKELGTTIKNAIMRPDGTWDAKWAAGHEIGIKKSIEEAINKAAGNDQYSKHLRDYGQGMKAVNDITIGREMEKALVSGTGDIRSTTFSNAMKNAMQTPDMLRPNGAARSGNIEAAMTPRGYGVMQDINNQLSSFKSYDDLVSAGTPQARKAIGAAFDPIPQVNLLNKFATLANLGIRHLEGKGGEKSMEALASMIQNNPEKLAELMKKYPLPERAKFFDALRQASISQAGLLGSQP